MWGELRMMDLQVSSKNSSIGSRFIKYAALRCERGLPADYLPFTASTSSPKSKLFEILVVFIGAFGASIDGTSVEPESAMLYGDANPAFAFFKCSLN